MSRYIAALAVVLAIVGIPVVATVCEMTCASRAETAAERDAGHHSCPLPEPTSEAGLTAVPHACGHQPGEALDQALQQLTAPLLVESETSLLLHGDGRRISPRATDIQHSPPRPLALISQLRV
jgi:hypothetical protein